MNLASIPLVDHHCHSLRRDGPPLDAPAFRSHFSESRDPALLAHLPESLFYRRALRDLAAFLGCGASEREVLAERAARPYAGYAASLFAAARIESIYVDTGYRSADSLGIHELASMLPCAVKEVLRLETLAEGLIPEAPGLAALECGFRDRIRSARSNGIVALKSIAAYRGGLEISRPGRREAAAALRELRAERVRGEPPPGAAGKKPRRAAGAGPTPPLRLEDRLLIDYLLHLALAEAASLGLPVQFHTGFGDDDADLRSANPLHLRSILQEPAYRGAPIVLLHCWPFVREAGYLAGIYGNVYVDLSLTIPFTAHGGAAAIRAALEQAPVSKVLLSTDASGIPELFYLGALYARAGLSQALEDLRSSDWMTGEEAGAAARSLLHGNARRVYGAEEG